MFWEIFYNLCLDAKMKPLQVVKQIGISHGSITKWKNGAVPSGASLQKIAEYFDVTVDYLLGKEDKKIPLGPIVKREDELWSKITALDEADRIKADAFISGLLAADKYGATEHTHQIKIAARGGGVKEITVTDSQLEALKGLPEITNLD